MSNKIKLEIRNMTKLYKNNDGVRNINLKVNEGELVTLLGPSGCGKTTILRTIGGFLNCDQGSILIDGKPIEHLPPENGSSRRSTSGFNSSERAIAIRCCCPPDSWFGYLFSIPVILTRSSISII